MKILKEKKDEINNGIKNVKYWMMIHERLLKNDNLSASQWETQQEHCIDEMNNEIDRVRLVIHKIRVRNKDEEIQKQCDYYFKKLRNVK